MTELAELMIELSALESELITPLCVALVVVVVVVVVVGWLRVPLLQAAPMVASAIVATVPAAAAR
ncbi:MAG: hypothetical protein JWR32_4009 [Mycobacterium sp.]|jgi:hypothetical protein|nr:hypothetical protein [Mycobacterium sp.]